MSRRFLKQIEIIGEESDAKDTVIEGERRDLEEQYVSQPQASVPPFLVRRGRSGDKRDRDDREESLDEPSAFEEIPRHAESSQNEGGEEAGQVARPAIEEQSDAARHESHELLGPPAAHYKVCLRARRPYKRLSAI
jgi:hypothetical protein